MLAYEYLGSIIVIVCAIAVLFLFIIMLDIFQLKVVIQFNNMILMIILA